MATYLYSRSVEDRAPMMSPDGYIRIPLASLDALPFVHLFSESDSDFLQELQSQTIPASSAGFSEWQSASTPAVSIGWAWFIHSESGRMLLAPDEVRSNVMLIDAYGYDLGHAKTSQLFYIWLGEFDWQDNVSMALRNKLTC